MVQRVQGRILGLFGGVTAKGLKNSTPKIFSDGPVSKVFRDLVPVPGQGPPVENFQKEKENEIVRRGNVVGNDEENDGEYVEENVEENDENYKEDNVEVNIQIASGRIKNSDINNRNKRNKKNKKNVKKKSSNLWDAEEEEEEEGDEEDQ